MSIACGRPQGGRGVGPCGRMGTQGGGQNMNFCGRYKWMAPRAIRGARDFIDEPGYLPEDLKALSLCYHRPPVICTTLNPRSTSDELTGMVAKMCFAMFSLVVLN